MGRKICLVIFAILTFSLLNIGGVLALVQQLDYGEYQTPDGWGVVAIQQPIDLDHYSYYMWGLDDLDWNNQLEQINIVFHGIHDWRWHEDDVLKLYIKDGKEVSGTEVSGWQRTGWDGESTSAPDWTGTMGFSAIDGSWSDPNGGPYDLPDGETTKLYDVVFAITDTTLLSWLQNGNGFILGIDPDCHYWGDKITVEAPVPEPATMLLFGIGLCGLAFVGRKRLIKES